MTVEEYRRKVTNDRHRKWRKDNKERVSEIAKKHYYANREDALLRMKLYREKIKKEKHEQRISIVRPIS